MTENEFNYWAFLSYSQQDNCGQRPEAPGADHLCWGDWLHETLKTFSVPAEFAGQINARGEIIPERMDAIYQDREEQSGNASLGEDTRKALEQSKYLVVIASPRSARSRHVNEAVRYFKQLGRGSRILPIVIAGEPNASDGRQPGASPEDECFVPAMRHPVQPDGTLDSSRHAGRYIFADARHGVGKREILASDLPDAESELEKARIRLIAGLIGVGYNGLLQREQARRFVGFAEAQRQAREAQSKLLEAQQQAREAQEQVAEARHQARAAESRVLEAHTQARNIEGQVAEARHQAREAQTQLEAAQNQVREAQHKVLEIQNLPQEVKSQIQEAQNQVLEAQTQARNTQGQLEAARVQAQEAQNKYLEAQAQVREVQSQVMEFQNQARQVRSQIEEARSQAQIAELKVLEEQRQARETQRQVEAARQQVREAQGKVQEIQNQTRDVQGRIQEAQSQASEAQKQALAVQDKARTARRMMKVFAVMAALALMAAGVAGSIAWSHRQTARRALARAASAEALAASAIQAKPAAESQPQPPVPPVVLSDDEPGDMDALFQIAAWDSWLSMDRDGALEWLGSLEDEELADVLDTWSQFDLTAATDWVESLPEGGRKDEALLALIQTTKDQLPGVAAKCCTLLATVQPSLQDIQDIASLLAEDDLFVALEWAQSLKDDASRAAALSVLPELSSPTSPEVMVPALTNSPAEAVGEVTNAHPSDATVEGMDAPKAE
jgi:uncharacterized coiled-coil DUF342 family protein